MVNYNLLLNENNFEYCTPKYIVDMFGPFDYDPASTKEFHKITENVGTKLYIPNSRIKFMKLYTETEETPTFSCVIFRIQATNELAFFDIE